MAAEKGLRSSPATIQAELRRILRSGFPLSDATAGDVLSEQRVVIANAQHPNERASRITALERVLRRLLQEFGGSTRGRAARILFGADRGLRGTTLTFRRGEAAEVLDRNVDHMRKHIERRILEELAFAFHQENLRYTPASDSARPPIATHEDTPVLTDESYTEEEELLCKVWSAVYGYRAEVVAIQRRLIEAREEQREPDADLEEHIDTGTWQLARLLTFIAEYLDRYGKEILHGKLPFSIDGLVALAGWHGGIHSTEAKRLRFVVAKVGTEERAAFLGESGRIGENDGRPHADTVK
jgi:hypothetical protein